ncbi:MAG: PA0069 family radical SAM protein [Rhodothermales bacterium]|nr:PA0069 family radical SAM protein [Rhodothermales bacterium]
MQDSTLPTRHGRAAGYNPPNRFEPMHLEEDPAELDPAELRQIKTLFFHDTSKSALSKNDSPDIPFTYSINPYRGCEHGCIYCYARPSHEYLGFSAGLDFESRIVVKQDLPRLLAEAFDRLSWQPQPIMLSGNTDCYQPVERRLKITRACLEVFARYRNPVSVITKNALVTRDLDVLEELAALNLVHVAMSITSLKPDIIQAMEPRTSRPAARLRAVEQLAARGIPVAVMVGPVVPGLTDEELPAIIEAAAAAGATRAYYVMLRLPGPVRELFLSWLERAYPDRKQRVINRLTDLRGESLTDGRFGVRMRGEGHWADVVNRLYRMTCRRLNLNQPGSSLATEHFRRPATDGQLSLFA